MSTFGKSHPKITINPVSMPLLLGMVLLSHCYSGCSGNNAVSQQRATGVNNQLVGKWKVLDGNFQGTIIEFTAGGLAVANTQHKWMPGESLTGRYSMSGNTLVFTDTKELKSSVTYEVEYQSTNSVMTIQRENAYTGFDGFDGRWERIGLPHIESSDASGLDFTGLRGVLTGQWIMKDTEGVVLDFTEKSIERKEANQYIETGFHRATGKFELRSELLHVTDEYGREITYGLEFLSDAEISLRPEKLSKSPGERESYGNFFGSLQGRWQRISMPHDYRDTPVASGPIADAKRQVERIEQKLTKLESVMNSALADRDDLARKLRSLGVNSPTDLKGNIRGKRIAENLVKLTTEIERINRHMAVIDTELLKAKSIVRRMEREQASLSEEELRNLATQLSEAEERTDGTPLTLTPLDVDSAVEAALKTSAEQAAPGYSK